MAEGERNDDETTGAGDASIGGGQPITASAEIEGSDPASLGEGRDEGARVGGGESGGEGEGRGANWNWDPGQVSGGGEVY